MKILIVNIKYLGDLVVSTPGLSALRKTYPDAEIVLLIRKGFEEIFYNNTNINRTILFDPKLKGNSGFANFIKGLKFIKKIRDEKFDIVISLHPGDRTAFWAWFSGAKIRIAPRKQSFGFLFNKRIDVNEDSISYMEYYNTIFSSVTGGIVSAKTEIFLPDDEKMWAENFLKASSIDDKIHLIGMHPSASEPTKIWPARNFIELIRKLIKIEGVKILLIEGPQDEKVCSEIKKEFTGSELLNYKSGSILRTSALINLCSLFVTHDTGTRHLSVALNKPVLALIPEDNLKYWNFYSSVKTHYEIVGERHIPDENDSSAGFLDKIEVEKVFEKIKMILNL